jgi:hypothetical protein
MIPNADITLYNKYIENRVEKWRREVIFFVVWEDTKSIQRISAGKLDANNATIFFPFALRTGYVTPKAWAALEDKSANWTLQEGDIIVRGAVTDEITEAVYEDEALVTPAFTVKDLQAKYDEFVKIVSVSRMDQGSPNMRHWEVGCK